MDPLSITTAVLSISATSIKVARALNHLREKFRHARLTIMAMSSESTVVSASLSRMQHIILTDRERFASKLGDDTDLAEVFDCALTNCSVVLEVIDHEIHKLMTATAGTDQIGWKVKCQYIWNEPLMQDLLGQLRGQQTALTLLLQAIQTESIQELGTLMKRNTAMVEQIEHRSRSLRQAHPEVDARESIFEPDDIASVYTGVTEGTGMTAFDFDNFLFNSKVYRRAFAADIHRGGNDEVARPVANDQLSGVAGITNDDTSTIHARAVQGGMQEASDDAAFVAKVNQQPVFAAQNMTAIEPQIEPDTSEIQQFRPWHGAAGIRISLTTPLGHHAALKACVSRQVVPDDVTILTVIETSLTATLENVNKKLAVLHGANIKTVLPEGLALLVDERTLIYALDRSVKKRFYELTELCRVLIYCDMHNRKLPQSTVLGMEEIARGWKPHLVLGLGRETGDIKLLKSMTIS